MAFAAAAAVTTCGRSGRVHQTNTEQSDLCRVRAPRCRMAFRTRSARFKYKRRCRQSSADIICGRLLSSTCSLAAQWVGNRYPNHNPDRPLTIRTENLHSGHSMKTSTPFVSLTVFSLCHPLTLQGR